jgi:hypothetical protein
MKTAPETYEGKHLVFEERFVSNAICSTELSAKCVLESIRCLHHKSKGWVEIDAGIEHVDGGFRAYRHHAKYR